MDDAPALLSIYSDPEAMRYWSSGPWTSLSQAEAYAAAGLAGYEDGTMLRIGIEAGGALAGIINVYRFDAQNRRCELGYMLGRSHWGKGYMSEALRAVLDYVFDEYGLHRIEADIDPRNEASAKLLQGLHFIKEGHLRQRWIVNGEICDSDIYGLLRSDWRRAV